MIHIRIEIEGDIPPSSLNDLLLVLIDHLATEHPDIKIRPLVEECEAEQDEQDRAMGKIWKPPCEDAPVPFKDHPDGPPDFPPFVPRCFPEKQGWVDEPDPSFCESCGREILGAQFLRDGKTLCLECHEKECSSQKNHEPIDPPGSLDEKTPTPSKRSKKASAEKEPTIGQRAWTDAEREILLWSGNAKEALDNYRENYPDSSRGDKAISSMWYHFKNTSQLKFSFKIDQEVRINDPDLPQYGQIGKAVELRQKTVLVSVGSSSIWVSKDSVEVVSSAPKN